MRQNIEVRVCDVCGKSAEEAADNRMIGGSPWSGWYLVEMVGGGTTLKALRGKKNWDVCGDGCLRTVAGATSHKDRLPMVSSSSMNLVLRRLYDLDAACVHVDYERFARIFDGVLNIVEEQRPPSKPPPGRLGSSRKPTAQGAGTSAEHLA